MSAIIPTPVCCNCGTNQAHLYHNAGGGRFACHGCWTVGGTFPTFVATEPMPGRLDTSESGPGGATNTSRGLTATTSTDTSRRKPRL